MQNNTWRKLLGVFLSLLIVATFFSSSVQSYYFLPHEQMVSVGDKLNLNLNLPQNILRNLSIEVEDADNLLQLSGNTFNLMNNTPVALEPGQLNLQLRLFGLIPLKKINVDVVPGYKLIPGGHSIGVLLRTEGVMVVGYSPVRVKDGFAIPAKDAGIEPGDVITHINDTKVYSDEQVAKLVNAYGKINEEIYFTINHEESIFKKQIIPIYCEETKTYRIGLFIRDNAGGVGTLTFIDPNSNKYGALGHLIADGETNRKININSGKIVFASVHGIEIGQRGKPGEKIGLFVDNSTLGNIQQNMQSGIYGEISTKINNNIYKEGLPVAFANQIQKGEASILTVVEDQKIEEFKITIEKTMIYKADGKEMVIRITDPKLIKKTGGIIQGMSGSPIIQNGKIIGAVSHVFVNDPLKGYAVSIETMLKEAGILNNKLEKAN